jgi:hypothetical protein
MRRTQRQHVANFQLTQPLPKATVLPVERVSHHGAKRDGYCYGTTHQFHCDLEFGAKCPILFAFLKVVSWRVGLKVNGGRDVLVSPQTAHRDHCGIELAQIGQVVFAEMRRLVPAGAHPVFVDH